MAVAHEDPPAGPGAPKDAAAADRRRRFSRAALITPDWYRQLARLCITRQSATRMLEFATELAARLDADGFVILHYPHGAAPRLLYGRTDRRHRATSMNEYLSGHYALDPFYLRADYCSRQGMVCLRDVIEEDFAASEYYKRHYQPAGLMDELCFCSDDGEGGHLNFALSRVVGKERFSRAEHEAARIIAPLVNAALAGSWKELSPGSVPAATEDNSHHRHITQSRMHFGRSVLTEREFEILQQLLQGKSVGFIARHFEIAASTVKVHRKHIYAKLGINSQAELFTLFLEVIARTVGEEGQDPLQTYRRTRPP